MTDARSRLLRVSDMPSDIGETSELLRLNNDHATELSFLTADAMNRLVENSFMACRVGAADAFVIAHDQDADHDSLNYLWFRQRFPRFVYIDRIVVDPRRRGLGLARTLYEAVFAKAVEAAHDRVVCEVNIRPPNDASHAFHRMLGFEAVDSAVLPGGEKEVQYYSKRLP